ncbi:hypothetical protein, partial [Geomonas edaphica]|uniref:hypothetical protein n=1 Tax=Geomonas edaphica TaxID=2570226 RepID=UPI001C100D7F
SKTKPLFATDSAPYLNRSNLSRFSFLKSFSDLPPPQLSCGDCWFKYSVEKNVVAAESSFITKRIRIVNDLMNNFL